MFISVGKQRGKYALHTYHDYSISERPTLSSPYSCHIFDANEYNEEKNFQFSLNLLFCMREKIGGGCGKGSQKGRQGI